MPEPRAVLLDSDVYSLVYITSRRDQQERILGWRRQLAGSAVAISFQTRAEVWAGLVSSNWGEPRRAEARQQLDSTPTIGVDEDVVEEYAALTAACRRTGHALAAKQHTGDRWIAACAIAKDIPLLSGDRIYADAPGLELLPPS